MDVHLVSDWLLLCTLFNYAVLLAWFVAFSAAHEWMFKLHARWFQLPVERFDALHYGAMALYKVGILLLNLVPYVALRLASTHSSA
jgi:hypothetical protein